MPASRTFSTRSIRSEEQHPYPRPQEPLNRYTAYREPSRALHDTRENTSPRIINSQSLLNPSFSEKQTWSKMGTTLYREVQSSRLPDVPYLAEDVFTGEAISKGMAKAKGDASFNITFSGIITTIRDVPLRIGKFIAVNFWQGLREDAVVPETAGVPISTDTDSNMQTVKVNETNTTSSDQDSQATQLDENASLASGSNEDGTKVDDDAIPPSVADLKKDTKGKGEKKVDNKPKKPPSSEEQTAIFLNRIADQIRETFGINSNDPKRRVFSARFKDKAPDDAPINCIRKPDCAVLDYNVAVAKRARWSDVHSLIEIKKSNAGMAVKDAYSELLNCARMVFAAQHNRRFVLGATISGVEMIFYVFDRSGVVGSKTIDINTDPEFLIRVICGLIFVDDIRLGFDTTIKKKDNTGYAITMNGIEFDCEEPMYIEKAVRGRGTGCFKTMHNGDEAVIKDSWVDESRKRLEHEILEKIKDVEGVVKVIDHEIVQVEGKDDSTSVVRRRLAENNLWDDVPMWKGFNMIEARTHRRILMKPYGQPLESFASLRELMLAVKDIVKVIEDLIEKKVLHRDISLRNLILAREDPNDPNSRIRGYLIDFDYALDLENISEDVAKGARTGTLPFMAIEMLVEETSNRVPHAYYHDLESVFYSLCWLCTAQEGPYDTPRCESDDFKFSESTIAKWNGIGIDNPVLEDIRARKGLVVYSDSEFTKCVLKQFAPYFAPLKPVVVALRDIMINKDSNLEDMEPYLLKKLEQNKEALAKAREYGLPISPYVLAGIPKSERDPRDVFNSIYDIIDTYLVDLEEPKLPDACKKPPKEAQVKVKKLSRKQIDINLPKGVRELVDGNAEARAYRANEVAITKKKEKNEKGRTEPPTDASNQIPYSGIVLRGSSHPGPNEPTDTGEDADIGLPSSVVDQRMVSTDETRPFGMDISRPRHVSFSTAQQPKSYDSGIPETWDFSSGLIASPEIEVQSQPRRTNKSSRNTPPPSNPRRAKQRRCNERGRAPTPPPHSPPHSPPPTSQWPVSSKRSASEFEADEPGQRTPTQASPSKKQRLG